MSEVYLSQLTDNPTRELYNFACNIPQRENGFENPFKDLFNYEEFRISLSLLVKEAELDSAALLYESRAPQYYYWIRTKSDRELIGLAKVRFLMTGVAFRQEGHLDFWIKSEARSPIRYSETLKELLRIEKDHFVRDVWITALDSNALMRHAIEQAGGTHLDEIPTYIKDNLRHRYWIKL